MSMDDEERHVITLTTAAELDAARDEIVERCFAPTKISVPLTKAAVLSTTHALWDAMLKSRIPVTNFSDAIKEACAKLTATIKYHNLLAADGKTFKSAEEVTEAVAHDFDETLRQLIDTKHTAIAATRRGVAQRGCRATEIISSSIA